MKKRCTIISLYVSGYEIGLLAEHLQLMGKARVVAKILIGQKKKNCHLCNAVLVI